MSAGAAAVEVGEEVEASADGLGDVAVAALAAEGEQVADEVASDPDGKRGKTEEKGKARESGDEEALHDCSDVGEWEWLR